MVSAVNAVQNRHYNWTRLGLRVIGALIKATITHNKEHQLSPASLRDFEESSGELGVSHATVRNYANAGVRDPQQNGLNAPALAAIAPHLYHFVGFGEKGEIYYDPNRTYGSWVELAEHIGELNTHSFQEDHEFQTYPDNGFVQLSLPTQYVPRGELEVVIEAILRNDRVTTALMERLEARMRARGSEVPKRLSDFLQSWIEEASTAQLSGLGLVADAPWPQSKDRIAELLSQRAGIPQPRAKCLLNDESRLTEEECWRFSLLFQEAGTGRPYNIEIWRQFLEVPGEVLAAS